MDMNQDGSSTKPLLEVICFPLSVTVQEPWVRRYIAENSWTSDCPHENSHIVISKNGMEIELARKEIVITVDNLLKSIYYHFAAFVIHNDKKCKITDSDYLCFGHEDFKMYIDKMALFFTLHDIEINKLAD